MEAGGKHMCVHKGIERKEVKKAIYKVKNYKAAGVDGIFAKILKYAEETVMEWMFMICKFAWRQRSTVPDA